jgi:hypothetical protein
MKYQMDYSYKDNSPLKYLTDNYGLSIKLCEKDDVDLYLNLTQDLRVKLIHPEGNE